MKFRNSKSLLLAVTVLVTAFATARLSADDESFGKPQKTPSNDFKPHGPPEKKFIQANAFGAPGPFTIKFPGNDAANKIRAAAEAVRDAKDSKEKDDAQKKLADVLSKCYDEDMAQREKELTQ